MEKINKKRELGVIICEHILAEERPVKLAFHHHDNTWEMMCGEPDHFDYQKAKVVGINHLIDFDKSIIELETLPSGFVAERNNIKDEWKICEFEEE